MWDKTLPQPTGSQSFFGFVEKLWRNYRIGYPDFYLPDYDVFMNSLIHKRHKTISVSNSTDRCPRQSFRVLNKR